VSEGRSALYLRGRAEFDRGGSKGAQPPGVPWEAEGGCDHPKKHGFLGTPGSPSGLPDGVMRKQPPRWGVGVKPHKLDRSDSGSDLPLPLSVKPFKQRLIFPIGFVKLKSIFR